MLEINDLQYKVFCDLLRVIRRERNLNQQELASRLNKPQSFVSKYEAGERRLDILELRQICLVIEISLTDFVVRLEQELSKADYAG